MGHSDEERGMMRFSHLSVPALIAVLAAGCTEGRPGGPGVTQTNKPTTTNPTTTTPPATTTPPSSTVTTNKPVIGNADQTFSLDAPNLPTSLKQGETETITIALSRGSNFDQDVTLELSGMPQGVTADPQKVMIKHGESEASVKLQAADDAALGDFTIKVNGHPATGPDAHSEFKLKINEK
jgi:hypothetical protein